MNPYAYTNGAGKTYPLYERPLEPKDCWCEEPDDPDDEEYDREEDEMSGRLNRR